MKIFKGIKTNRGMTYVELIVVLSIFAVLSSVAIYNYGDFQSSVDIKNLASDIALKVVEAQKSSLSGLLPPPFQYNMISSPETWKPSYGVYFNLADNKNFVYFTDVDADGLYTNSDCSGECLEKITITKNNIISNLDACYATPCVPNSLSDLTITFSRPSSSAVIKSSTPFSSPISYVQITVTSPKGITAAIKLYPSGRVQVN